MWLNAKHGILRKNILGYVKEKQYRINHSGEDIFTCVLEDWATLEYDLRNGVITEKKLWNLLLLAVPYITIGAETTQTGGYIST